MNDSASSEDENEEDRPLSRDERIELFGEDMVEQTEWSAEQSQMVRSVIDDALDYIAERNDVVISQTGSTVRENGKHEARIRFHVAGDPLEDCNGN